MAVQEKKKLTLRLDNRLIERARQYADRHNTSISKLVEVFFQNLDKSDEQPAEHTALVQELTGILPEEVDLEAERFAFLLEKYGR